MLCSAAPVCPLAQPGTFKPFEEAECSLSFYHPPSSFSSRSAETWRTDSVATCSQQATATFTLLLSPLSRATRTPRQRAVHSLSDSDGGCFDLFSFLPVEISLKILHYLGPEDLCHVRLVCRHWYQLSNSEPLHNIWKTFVENQRSIFKLSKENYLNGAIISPHHNIGALQHSTPLLSPLSLNVSAPLPSQSLPRSHGSHRRQYTPGPMLSTMVDNVGRLNLSDSDSDIRRCLFPNTDDSKQNTSTICVPHQLDLCPNSSRVIGKKSKNRLRRL